MNPPDRPLLGPHCVGQRVVVRHLVRGERGPSGGPALTDVLGLLETWDDGRLAVRTKDGLLVEIDVDDVVAGKPVPPRPRRRPTSNESDAGEQI